MGIDLIRGGRIPNRGVHKTKSTNPYLKSLIRVHPLLPSFTPSSREGPIADSTRSSTSVSTRPDSTVTPFRSPALPSTSASKKTKQWPSSAPSQTMSGSRLYPRESTSAPSGSPNRPESVCSPTAAKSSPGTNSPRRLPLGRT